MLTRQKPDIHIINTQRANKLSQVRHKIPQKRPFSKQQQISFGSAGNVISRSGLFQRAGFFIKGALDKTLKNGVNQNFANAINYGGKALISPLMIYAAAPFTKEDEDSIKYSMLMQPIQAGLAFASSLGLSFLANRAFDKAAKKGTLGNFIDPTLGKFFQNKAHLDQLKSKATTLLTAVVIPASSAILFWALPKIMKKLDKETPPPVKMHADIYAKGLRDNNIFASGLRPEFGMLTKDQNR